MKKALSEIAKDAKYLFATILIFGLVLKIAYYNEGLASLIRIIASLSVIFIIPGYLLGIRWTKEFSFLERIVVGSFFCMCASALFSYLMGIAGLHVKYHMYITPVFFSLLGVLLFVLKKKSHSSPATEDNNT